MNIFIDTISNKANIILFDSNKKIINNTSWIIKWNESSTLIPEIDKLLKKNNANYLSLENIIVINWPWSFTWVRTTVLAINTINYIIKKNITPINFFDLYNSYPIIKSSSKRDCFFKKSKSSKIKILNNNDINTFLQKNNIKKVYGEANNKLFEKIEILEKIDYLSIITNIKFENKKQIEPLYIKKPNIS